MMSDELKLKAIEARKATALALRLVGELHEALPRRTKLTHAWYHLKDGQTSLLRFCQEEAIGEPNVRTRQI